MLKLCLSALTFFLVPVAAKAGDACPVQITINDLGAPAWLDRDALLAERGGGVPWIGYRNAQENGAVKLTYIHPNSPAERAGLTAGSIVRGINGVPVDSIADYAAIMDGFIVGDAIQMETENNGIVTSHTITVGQTDPVPIGLERALAQSECTYGILHVANKAEQLNLHPYLYDSRRTFRCHDAHIAMQGLGDPYAMDTVYVLRGTRRIIISMPHWGTTCVNVSDVSGPSYTEEKLLSVIESVISDFVAIKENDI